MANLVQRFRRWFDYEQDAHAQVFASFNSVPPAGRDTPAFRKAAGLMAHLVAARRVWLSRLGAVAPAPGPLFPENADIAQVADDWGDLRQRWADYLAGLDDAGLVRIFEYQSIDGKRFRNSVEEVLTQLFGHSSYHRGQIATLIRAAGGEPAITDFIYWCRQSV